jgi:hypothetical protein
MVYGVDAVQALLLAMQIAHTYLLAARERDGRSVSWLENLRLGLPVADSVRHWDVEGAAAPYSRGE